MALSSPQSPATDIRSTHTSANFVRFLNKVNRNVPDGLDVHVILDNLSAHNTPDGAPLAAETPLVPPPLHADLRIVDEPRMERWFSALTTKKLQRSAHRSVKALAADIEAWAPTWNENPKPFVWHKTAEEILERLAGYCSAVNHDVNA